MIKLEEYGFEKKEEFQNSTSYERDGVKIVIYEYPVKINGTELHRRIFIVVRGKTYSQAIPIEELTMWLKLTGIEKVKK